MLRQRPQVAEAQAFELRPVAVAVVAGGQVERALQAFPARALGAGVEAALALPPGAALGDHPRDQRVVAQAQHIGIVRRQGRLHAGRDMRHQVDANQVEQPEDTGLRHADRPAHGGIGFLDGQAEVEGAVDRRLHPHPADAVGDEAGPVLAGDDGLAQRAVTEFGDGGDGVRTRRRAAHHFQQPHVARRVEEVGDQEVGGEPLPQPLDQRGERDGRGVRRHDRAQLPHALQLGIEVALGVRPFDDGLDDPVAVGDQRQVGRQVAGRDQPRRALVHEGRRIGAQHRLHRLRRATRHDVEQHHRHAGIRHLRRDAGAHHAGANDRHLADRRARHRAAGRRRHRLRLRPHHRLPGGARHHTASSTVAMPWPPPMHCVASA